MRRKRKTKYTWLPVLGQENATGGVPHQEVSSQTFFIDLPNDGTGPNVGATPLTFDTPQDQSTSTFGTEPLVDIIGNEYFLRRIVGKVVVGFQGSIRSNDDAQVVIAANVPAIQVAAGFLIARADPGNLALPQEFTTNPRLYDALGADTMREPWIWRRSWILGWGDIANESVVTGGVGAANEGVLGSTLQGFAFMFPSTNVRYGSVLDGPHVDAKTARRIRQDERLWFVASAQSWPTGRTTPIMGGAGASSSLAVAVDCNVRMLGALRKARNRGVFT